MSLLDLLTGQEPSTSLDARRRRPRRAGQDEHRITVLDGLGAGEDHGCVFREMTAEGVSLLVKANLGAGQRVRIQQLNEGVPTGQPMQGEIVRSRPLTTGRYDLLVEFPRQNAAPKVSESQRRHQRRQTRVTRIGDTA